MRIDGPPLSAMTPFLVPPQQMGSGQMFGDLFSDPQPEPGGPPPGSAPARPLFSFDALGVLGLGRFAPGELRQAGLPPRDLPGADARQERDAPSDGQWGHISAMMPAAVPVQVVPQALSPADASGHAGAIKMEAASVAGKSVLHAPMSLPARWGALATAFGGMEHFVAAPGVPAGAAGSRAIVFSLHTNRSGASMDTSEAGDPMEPRAERTAFTAESHADPAPGQVSVAVAEEDGTVHVVAAAPGLSEDARLKIRGIAEDLATDAGVALGEFSLNGATIPESFTTVRRSSHGGFGHKRGI